MLLCFTPRADIYAAFDDAFCHATPLPPFHYLIFAGFISPPCFAFMFARILRVTPISARCYR